MFRRDKDNRLDNEGLRRMREAIRQRLDQEEGAAAEDEETAEAPYRQANAAAEGDETFDEVAPFNPDTAGTYGAGSDTSGYSSYLTPGRQDRILPTFEAPAIPARAEAAAWTPSAPEPAAPAGPAETTVAAETTWHGTLRSSANIQIEGTFEGQIETEQNLLITGEAKVEATVRAVSITVAGELSGQINCRERLEVLPTGRVSGQIDAGSFVVHEGAYLGGQVRMTGTGNAEGGARPMLQRVR